jgi:hypothetical protein
MARVRRSPKQPKLPPAPRLPRLPPLHLAPVRPHGSMELDRSVSKAGASIGDTVPFVRFDRFMLEWEWNIGEHLTTIGVTGSGKTVLNRHLLRRRAFVCLMGVKNHDPELYGPFEREGYELVHSFDPVVPEDTKQRKVLYVPLSAKYGTEGRAEKGRKFRGVLNEIYDVGHWCAAADDVQYMVDKLKVGPELEELWMLGRSEGVTVAASSQEPVDIPVMAYGMATHLFLFGNPDVYRAKRMAELTGLARDVTEKVILGLPEHEFLYINRKTRKMLRSKVIGV